MRKGEGRTRRHIWINDDQWEFLRIHYEDSIGTSAAIRAILQSFISNLQSRVDLKSKAISPLTIEEITNDAADRAAERSNEIPSGRD